MRMKRLIGYDIGGTKCCVLYGTAESDSVKVRDKIRFETTDVDATIRSLFSATRAIMSRNSLTAGAVWGLVYRFWPEKFGAVLVSHALWDAAVFVWFPL